MDLLLARIYRNVFLLLLLLVSTGDFADGALPLPKCTPSLSKDDSADWVRAFHFKNQKLPLKLEVSNRPTHWIINYIFKFLVNERLGYTDVQFVQQPSDSSEAIIDSLVCLDESCNHLPYAHINLEVWLPAGKSPNVLVPGSSVKDYGPLGPVAQSAFMSHEAFAQHFRAQASPKFVHHRGRNVIGEFPDNDEQNITCTGRDCNPSALRSELLSCSPHGSATNGSASAGQASTQSLSLFSWYPYGEYSGQTNVSCPPRFWRSTGPEKVATAAGSSWREGLPRPYSSTLMAHSPTASPASDGSNCRFRSLTAVKLGWSGLQTSLPLVHQLLTRFSLSHVEYDRLLTTIDQLPENPSSQEELDRLYQCIASKWVRDHHHLWLPWTTGWDKKQTLTIAGLFSFYGKWVEADLDKVALKTVNQVNNMPNYFLDTEYALELDVRNLTCSQDIVLNDYYTMLSKLEGNTLVGVIASLCSDSIQPVVEVANVSHTLVISPTVESTFYGEAARYPYFFRTVPSMSMAYQLLVRQFVIWGWKRVAVFRKDGHFITPRIFYSRNISLEVDFELKENALNDTDVTRALDKMGDHKSRILIVEYFAKGTAKILCAAAKRGWHFNAGYVWFLNPWLSHDWWLHDDVRPPECTVEEMANITAWTFTVDYKRADASDDHGQPTGGAIPHSFYGAYTKDAVHVLAFALAQLLRKNASAISVFNTPKVANQLKEIVSHTIWWEEKDALIPEPNIHTLFDAQNERISAVWLLKQHTLNDTKVRLVWTVNVTQHCRRPFDLGMQEEEEQVELDKCVTSYQMSEIFWPNGQGQIPGDGSDTAEDCTFRLLADWFRVTCATATGIFSVCMVIGLAVPLFATLFAYYRHKLKEAERRIRQPYEELCAELADIDLPSGDIILNRSVGQGAYGLVYGGEVKCCGQWEAAAVKLLDRKSSYEGKTDFLCEAKLMRNLNHKNVIRLMGICLKTKNNSLYLIMEFMPFGDLKAYLLSRRVLAKQSPEHEDICPSTLTRMATDVAEGLGYLHNMHLVHRDVACRNCLVGRDRVVKVSDFGLTRQLTESPNESYYRCMRNCPLPVRWMAPESFQFGTSNVQSDMWSYGIVLYEIITFGVFPYEALDDVEVISLVQRADFCILSMLPPAAAGTTISRLIQQCCQRQWQHRPSSMDKIVSLFGENPGCVRPFLTDEPPKPSTPIDLLPFQPGAGACMMSPDCPVSSNTQPVPITGVTVADLHATQAVGCQLTSSTAASHHHSLAMTSSRAVFSGGGGGGGSTGRAIVAGRSSLPYRSADFFSEVMISSPGTGTGAEVSGRRRHKTAEDTCDRSTSAGRFQRRGPTTSSYGTGPVEESGQLAGSSQLRHYSGGATSLTATAGGDDGVVSFQSTRSPSFSLPGSIFAPPSSLVKTTTTTTTPNCVSVFGRFGAGHKRSTAVMPNGNSDTWSTTTAIPVPLPDSSSGAPAGGADSSTQQALLLGSAPPIDARCDNNSLPNGIPSVRSLSMEYLTSHKKAPASQGDCTKSAPDQPLSAYCSPNLGKESRHTVSTKDPGRHDSAGAHPLLLGQMMTTKGRLGSVTHPTSYPVPVPTTNRSRANHMVRSVLRLITRSGKATAGLPLTTSPRSANSCAVFPNVEREQQTANHVEYLPLKPTTAAIADLFPVATALSDSLALSSRPAPTLSSRPAPTLSSRPAPTLSSSPAPNLGSSPAPALSASLGTGVSLSTLTTGVADAGDTLYRSSQPVAGP